MRDLRCFSDLKYTLMGSLNRLLSCPAKDNNGAARKSSGDFCKIVDIYYTLEFELEGEEVVAKTCKRPRSNRDARYFQGNLLLPVSCQRLCIHTLVSVFVKNYGTYPVFIYFLNNTKKTYSVVMVQMHKPSTGHTRLKHTCWLIEQYYFDFERKIKQLISIVLQSAEYVQ